MVIEVTHVFMLIVAIALVAMLMYQEKKGKR